MWAAVNCDLDKRSHNAVSSSGRVCFEDKREIPDRVGNDVGWDCPQGYGFLRMGRLSFRVCPQRESFLRTSAVPMPCRPPRRPFLRTSPPSSRRPCHPSLPSIPAASLAALPAAALPAAPALPRTLTSQNKTFLSAPNGCFLIFARSTQM